ncbi:MAG: hypothetical protein Q4A74_01705 [Cardiobacteriaceae bacterium]|nr:hypothetical protein [Cardiobacteriaceae bacterium]
MKKLSFLTLLFCLNAIALTLELDIGSGHIGDTPVDKLHLRAESKDGKQWTVSGQLPTTKLAASPLKNTLLDARLHLNNRDLLIEHFSLRTEYGKIPLRLQSDYFLLQKLLLGEIQFPPGATLRLQAKDKIMRATLANVNNGINITANIPLALAQIFLQKQGIKLHGALLPQIIFDGNRLHGTITLNDTHYSSADSMQAAEKLHGLLTLDAQHQDGHWQGDIALDLNAGELLITPIYLKIDGAPLHLQSHFDWQAGNLRLSELSISDDKANALADIVWDTTKNRLISLDLKRLSGDADNVYRRYLKPLLGDSLFGDAQLQGSFLLSGHYHNGQYHDLAAVMNHISIKDKQGRYEIRNLDGQMGNNGSPSQIAFASAQWHKLPIGAARAQFQWKDNDITLQKPLCIPILDGAIILHQFKPSQDAYKLSAQIEPISLNRLGETFDTIRFHGSVSGTLPDIRLNHDGLQLKQPVNVSIFDGNIQIAQLHISRFFSDAPYAGFDMHLHAIDLQQLTNAFGIGEIEGRIEGSVKDVMLTNWKPQKFNAHLETPKHNAGRKRISHEAVAYLSNIGGASNLMVGQFIRILNRFSYDKLGFNAQLQNGVLTLNGIAPATDSNGYYLVKGNGIPRLDIIGHTRKIDWNELLERLKNAENSEGAEVESKIGR